MEIVKNHSEPESLEPESLPSVIINWIKQYKMKDTISIRQLLQ